MTLNFTKNQLIKFLYRETDRTESQEIMDAMRYDVELKENFQELQSAYRQLPKVKFNASKSSLSAVLEYSKTKK